jgi:hypothetical protein
MSDKVDQLESDLVRYRELEGLLRTTLVSAEKAAVTLKEQARKEADLIVEEAPLRGAVDHKARPRRPRSAARRGAAMRSLLRSALALVDDEVPGRRRPEAPARRRRFQAAPFSRVAVGTRRTGRPSEKGNEPEG